MKIIYLQDFFQQIQIHLQEQANLSNDRPQLFKEETSQ